MIKNMSAWQTIYCRVRPQSAMVAANGGTSSKLDAGCSGFGRLCRTAPFGPPAEMRLAGLSRHRDAEGLLHICGVTVPK